MSERSLDSNPDAEGGRPIAATSGQIFAWRGGAIVLLAERTGDRWLLTRGWRQADQLTDIRRWSFETPERFVAQIRRLVCEAGADRDTAAEAAAAANRWVAAQRSGAAEPQSDARPRNPSS